MNTRDLKNLLKDELELNDQLVNFAYECLRVIYVNEECHRFAIIELNNWIDHFEDNGCICDLDIINEKIEYLNTCKKKENTDENDA